MNFLEKRKILLIISGGIAAYKSLDLIRSLIKIQCEVKTILTKGGAEFVTPLSIHFRKIKFIQICTLLKTSLRWTIFPYQGGQI